MNGGDGGTIMEAMNRFFNTVGPCVPGEHYLLDASERLLEVVELILRKQCFVIHAARQSGKTTLLLDLRKTLESEGRHRALYCSLESLQGVTDPSVGIPGILDAIRAAVMAHPEIGNLANTVTAGEGEGFTLALRSALTRLCAALDKPLVLLLDEVDCLSEGTLITFLRQLRDGFVNRAGGSPFPSSVALVGMRNIRDYKAQIRPGARGAAASPGAPSSPAPARSTSSARECTCQNRECKQGCASRCQSARSSIAGKGARGRA